MYQLRDDGDTGAGVRAAGGGEPMCDCVKTLSQPSPMSARSASMRARNASASRACPAPPSSSAPSAFVPGSNTNVLARTWRPAERPSVDDWRGAPVRVWGEGGNASGG